MRRYLWCALLTAVLVLTGGAYAQGTYAPDADGWVPLFNGEDLTGWHMRHGGPNTWDAHDGLLVNTTPGVDLISDIPLEDQEIHVEFRVPKGGNSGVYLQGRFEVQVADTAGQPLNAGSCGALYSKLTPSTNAAKPAGEWQTYDIAFRAHRVDRDGKVVRPAWIKVVHNGVKVIESEFEGVTGGAVDDRVGVPAGLMLQGDHTAIEYRNIRYRPLRSDWAPESAFKPLFDGKTVAGWQPLKTGHGTGGQWTVIDGALCGTQDKPSNGGIFATTGEYTDYELRLDTNPDWDIDSGVFLRCTDDGRSYQARVDYRPGGEVGPLYGEGIGGWNEDNPLWERFYKPRQWNDIRVIVEGQPPRIQVWLNGVKLNDFVDTEERLARDGRIGLQVHGGGDWQGRLVRFRNIRIRTLGPQ